MTHRPLLFAAAVLLIGAITACASTPATSPGSTRTPTATATPSTPPAPTASTSAPVEDAPEQVAGTVVRFTSDRTSVDVTIGDDTPAVRDFLSLLPLELTVEEFAGTEKIAYLPRELNYAGSPGSDPEDGDLIYYAPWGNVAFYYDTTGVGYSDATLHVGTYAATAEQLSLLEGGPVTITLAD
ncbi:cyclophilin-like fold protein [Microbacterium sp. P07]|uniref:cyclophilin-like fold protein n=1 Tax=Microbacterium sp. P07 TaxID=3366952 RepID=UPI003745CD24